jgi:arabinofuranosyltransferase
MALLLLLLLLRHARMRVLLALAAAMPLAVLAQQSRWDYWQSMDLGYDHGIIEERQYFYDCSGSFNAPGEFLRSTCTCWLANDGIAFRDFVKDQPDKLNERGALGMFGYYAGPDIIVVDFFGLADPLLARLPMVESKLWRPGHFTRTYPEGYFPARTHGDMAALPPSLRMPEEEPTPS